MAIGTSSARISISLNGSMTKDVGTTSTKFEPNLAFSSLFGNGSSTAQANAIAQVSGSVTSASIVQVNLFALVGASLSDPAVFTKIAGLLVQNTTPSGGDLIVGDATGIVTGAWTNLFNGVATGMHKINPAGCLALVNPAGIVVSTSQKILCLDASAGTLTYVVTVLGVI